MQAILIGWFFGLFIGGGGGVRHAGGAGRPAAGRAWLPAGARCRPRTAGPCAGVSFGAVGTPTLAQIDLTGLSPRAFGSCRA